MQLVRGGARVGVEERVQKASPGRKWYACEVATQALLSEMLQYNDTGVGARPLPTCSSRWPRATRRRPPRPTPPANELERLPQLRRDNRPCDTYVRARGHDSTAGWN